MDAATKARAKAHDKAFLLGEGQAMEVICMKSYERKQNGGPVKFCLFQQNPLCVVVTDIATDAVMDVEDFDTLDALLDVWMVD